MLTHQHQSSAGQRGERYYTEDDQLSEIPTDIPPNVVDVEIHGRQISTIRANVFCNLSQCATLYIGNNLSKIEPGAFNGLTALTSLSLYKNERERLHFNMFSDINSCKELYLGRNKINEIEPGAFNGLNALTNLLLGGNRLERLSVNMFLGLKNCEELNLGSNEIHEIEPRAFNGLMALMRLTLIFNRLEGLYVTGQERLIRTRLIRSSA